MANFLRIVRLSCVTRWLGQSFIGSFVSIVAVRSDELWLRYQPGCFDDYAGGLAFLTPIPR